MFHPPGSAYGLHDDAPVEPAVLDEYPVVELPRDRGTGNVQSGNVRLERGLIVEGRKRLRIDVDAEGAQVVDIGVVARENEDESRGELHRPLRRVDVHPVGDDAPDRRP